MKNLWLAIILQAFRDATSVDLNPKIRYAKRSARQWLLLGGPDFAQVCWNAGVNPGAVRTEANKLADNNWPKHKRHSDRCWDFSHVVTEDVA